MENKVESTSNRLYSQSPDLCTVPRVKAIEIVEHEKKVIKTPQELNIVFDLTRFNSAEFDGKYNNKRVEAVEEYLKANCNKLGTKSLSEAVNPIMLDCFYLERPMRNSHGELEF